MLAFSIHSHSDYHCVICLVGDNLNVHVLLQLFLLIVKIILPVD